MFDEIARQIGWIVIGGGIIYLAGKLLKSYDDDQNQKNQMFQAIWDHKRRLAYRKIWKSSLKPNVIEQVKTQYWSWVLLDMDLNDEEYDSKMRQGESSKAYCIALKEIEEKGLPFILKGDEIISTFSEEHESRMRKEKID